jgi:hypothetical protein
MNIVVKSYVLGVLMVAGLITAAVALGAPASTSVTVGNAAPTITNVAITQSPMVMTENTTASINVTADIADGNGCADVFSSGTMTGVLFRSGIAATSSCTQDARNCYRFTFTTTSAAGPCTGGTDTAMTVSSSIPVWYFADATDASSSLGYSAQWWAAYVAATDFVASSSNATSGTAVELSTLLGLQVTAAINYGVVAANANTGATNQVATTTNTGNSKLDIEFSGTNMTGPATIAAAQQKFGTTSVTYASLSYTLSTSAALQQMNMGIAVTSTAPFASGTYWGIAIPNGQVNGSYTGTNTFTAVWSSN